VPNSRSPARRRGRPAARISKPLAFDEREQRAIREFISYLRHESLASLASAAEVHEKSGGELDKVETAKHFLKVLKYLDYLELRSAQTFAARRTIDGILTNTVTGERVQ
jgi:hypothetical protein